MSEQSPPPAPVHTRPPAMEHKWIGVVVGVVAPTTLITGLCYYFGVIYLNAYYTYFGLDDDALNFSTAEYVRKSVVVLYPALVFLLAATCAGLWILVYGRRALRRGRPSRRVHRLGWAAIAAGAVLATIVVWSVVAPILSILIGSSVPILDWVLHSVPKLETPLIPATLGIGALLIAAGTEVLVTLRSRSSPRLATTAERLTWLLTGAALVLALFWQTNLYATFHGRVDAQATVSKLWTKQSVVALDTTEPLFAPPSQVHETALDPQTAQQYRYRYQCLRMLAVRPDRWVLVPARWSESYGYALIVPVDTSVRIIVTRRAVLAQTETEVDRKGIWPCPEVALPPS
ncbi:MAG: hypothetical protein EOP24_41280 [Hyphomicrobiales bacterium]|nr:MAG: hypothetical protein EOP24_41280 [Hyphomicrobiales bacterium]